MARGGGRSAVGRRGTGTRGRADRARSRATRSPGRRAAARSRSGSATSSATRAPSSARSPTRTPTVQAKVRSIGERHVAIAQSNAAAFGIDRVDMLPAQTLSAYVALNDRFEADENGLGAKIEASPSPPHRELYVLGALVGGEAADVESSARQARASRRARRSAATRRSPASTARSGCRSPLTPRDTPAAQVLGELPRRARGPRRRPASARRRATRTRRRAERASLRRRRPGHGAALARGEAAALRSRA